MLIDELNRCIPHGAEGIRAMFNSLPENQMVEILQDGDDFCLAWLLLRIPRGEQRYISMVQGILNARN